MSAVDSHVGKHIFERVIGPGGMLAGKTRVLVTHGITYLPKTDYIVVLKDGKISEQGTYHDLIERKGDFAGKYFYLVEIFSQRNKNIIAAFILEYMSEANADDADNEMKQHLSEKLGEEFVSRQLSTQQSVVSSKEDSADTGDKKVAVQEKKPEAKGQKLIEKETAETGSVKLAVYWYYIKSLGIIGAVSAIIGQVIIYFC